MCVCVCMCCVCVCVCVSTLALVCLSEQDLALYKYFNCYYYYLFVASKKKKKCLHGNWARFVLSYLSPTACFNTFFSAGTKDGVASKITISAEYCSLH